MRNQLHRRSPRHPLATAGLLVVIALGAMQGGASALATAAPVLVNQTSPSGWPAGISIYAATTMYYGNAPTGTITFKLYAPTDPTCTGAPMFTSTTAVNGNLRYTSPYVPTVVVGTYRWVTSYSGDSRNRAIAPSLCSDPNSDVTTSKRRPTVLIDASPVSSNGTITATVTVGAGGGPNGATGQIALKLYGPNNNVCAGTPTYTSMRTLNGPGTYTAVPFNPTAPGTYRWQALYNGDANNFGNGSMCGDPAGVVEVPDDTPTTTTPTTTTPTTVRPTTTTTPTTTPPTTIGGGSGAPTVGASPSTAPDGSTLSVNWSGIPTPTGTDWVAIYPVGGANYSTIAWRYTSGAAVGALNLTVPAGTPAGAYEVRFYPRNSYSMLDSSPLTVT